VHIRIDLNDETIHEHTHALLESLPGTYWKADVSGKSFQPPRRPIATMTVVLKGSQQAKKSPQKGGHAFPASKNQDAVSGHIARAHAFQRTTALEIARDVSTVEVRINAARQGLNRRGRPLDR
jgi:hypothetical protein